MNKQNFIHTVSKSSEYKSFKDLDFEVPPNTRSNLSSYSAATCLHFEEGPSPLKSE